MLSSLVDDRHAWDARNSHRHSEGEEGSSLRPEINEFPSVLEGLRDHRDDDYLATPGFRFWLLLRDYELVAVLDTDGLLHQRDHAPVNLLPAYRRAESSVTRLIGDELGQLLP